MSNYKIICTGNYQMDGWSDIEPNIEVINAYTLEENIKLHINRHCSLTKMRESKYNVDDLTNSEFKYDKKVNTIKSTCNDCPSKYSYAIQPNILVKSADNVYDFFYYVMSPKSNKRSYRDGYIMEPEYGGYLKMLKFEVVAA